jgi:hypothetical protein
MTPTIHRLVGVYLKLRVATMPDFPPIVILFLAAKAAPRYSVRLIPFGERGWAFTTIDNCTKNVRRFRTDEQGQGLYRLVGADEQNDHDASPRRSPQAPPLADPGLLHYFLFVAPTSFLVGRVLHHHN